MADDAWRRNRDAAQSSANGERQQLLLSGTPEEKINTWLELTKDQNGHLKAGVCVAFFLFLTPVMHASHIDQ